MQMLHLPFKRPETTLRVPIACLFFGECVLVVSSFFLAPHTGRFKGGSVEVTEVDFFFLFHKDADLPYKTPYLPYKTSYQTIRDATPMIHDTRSTNP